METLKWNVLTVCFSPIYLDLALKQMSIVIPHDQQLRNQMWMPGSGCSLCCSQHDNFGEEK